MPQFSSLKLTICLLLFLLTTHNPTLCSPSNQLSPPQNRLTCKHIFEYFSHFSSGDYSTLNCVINKLKIQTSEDLKECRNFRALPFHASILTPRYNSAFDAIAITNRLCQHNFDKIFGDYFENMRTFFRGSITKAKLTCYLRKMKLINGHASIADEFSGRSCKATFEEIEKFLEETRTELVEDLQEDQILDCMDEALIDEKVNERLEFKIMGNCEYTKEEIVELKSKHLGRFRRFEEQRIECFLKLFYRKQWYH